MGQYVQDAERYAANCNKRELAVLSYLKGLEANGFTVRGTRVTFRMKGEDRSIRVRQDIQ